MARPYSLCMLALVLSTLALDASAAEQDYNRQHNEPRHDMRRDTARVVRVEEMNDERHYQYQECWNERSRSNEGGYYRDQDGRLYRTGGDNRSGGNTGGAIIGALVGGALGNQVGKGDGRTAATVAGAVIGATIGNQTGRDRDGYERYNGSAGELRCRTIDDRDYNRRYSNRYGNYRNDSSYRVTYVYAGQTYQAMSTQRPGRSVRVLVDVRMQDGEYSSRR